MPSIQRILETALYVQDLEESTRFYADVLGLGLISRGDRLVAMDAGRGTVLLLFRAGATAEGSTFPGGWIPPHDARGPAHFAFAIAAEDYDGWWQRLSRAGVEIESEVAWDRGGRSLYLRDPEGHSVELATPGVWSTY
jgi:catechol 2,3-dioxygenase-like lactoylglutathione lyase family enzyme